MHRSGGGEGVDWIPHPWLCPGLWAPELETQTGQGLLGLPRCHIITCMGKSSLFHLESSMCVQYVKGCGVRCQGPVDIASCVALLWTDKQGENF